MVQGTYNAAGCLLHMRIDHGGLMVSMSEQQLVVRMSVPAASRRGAKECLSVCTLANLGMQGRCIATLNARCTVLSETCQRRACPFAFWMDLDVWHIFARNYVEPNKPFQVTAAPSSAPFWSVAMTLQRPSPPSRRGPTRRAHPKPTSWRQAGLPRRLRWDCLRPLESST